jgi:thymidylate synthase
MTDLIVNLGARLDGFSASMDQAAELADNAVSKIQGSFESLNPGFGGLATLGALLTGGLSAAAAAIVALNRGLADTAKQAERVGLTVERLQQLKFGASSIGTSDSDFSSSIEKFASNLQDAQFKSNDLLRVFQANGVAILDANGKLKDTDALLTQAVDIVKRAPTIQDAMQIGTMLGLSKEFSQQIYDTGDNFLRLAAQANAAGAVIDDATIDKAKTFTSEWQKASALWGAQMRAAIGDILPLLNDAVNGATAVVTAVKNAFSFVSSIKEFALPTDINAASLNQLTDQLKQYEAVRTRLQSGAVGDNGPSLGKLNPSQLFFASNAQEDGEITVATVQKKIDQIKERIDAFNKEPKNRILITANSNPSNNPGPKPQATSESRDQFEISVDQITKRTATLKADTVAAFENNAAQAQLRAEFQELTAIRRDEGEVTQEQIDKYEKLRTSMSAEQALAQSGIVLTKEHRDAFLSSSQEIGQATAAYDKAKDSLSKINSASAQVGSALSSSFADAVVDGKNLGDVLTNLGKQLEKMAISSVFASIFNAPSSGGPSPAASVLKGIFAFADGTDSAPGGLSLVGERGPELMNVPKGAQIIPNHVLGRGGGPVSIGGPTVVVNGNMNDAAMAQLQRTLKQHQQAITSIGRSMTSQARYQATGVG